MQKEEVLAEVKRLAAMHAITLAEITAAYTEGATGTLASQDVNAVPNKKSLSVSEVLLFIGGAIVFIGIGLMVSINWDILPGITRILITLGSALAFYVLGILFNGDPKHEKLSAALYFLSALLMPIGLFVSFRVAGLDLDSSSIQTLISLILLGLYFSSYLLFRKPLFVVFCFIFGTWLFFSFTNLLISDTLSSGEDFYWYRLLVASLSYLFFGYYFKRLASLSDLGGWLYGFGALGFLGSALALGGYAPDQNLFWELIYPLLVFGVIVASVYEKSRAFLIWGSIFLMIYIFKMTAEYFSEGLGWPITLIMSGLLIIAIGYGSIQLNRKYIAGTKATSSYG